MRKLSLISCGALLFFLTGCSEQTPEKKEPAKPADPVTGQTALYRMYQVARSWSSDVQVLKMSSIHLLETPVVPGKAGAWQATFTSAGKGRARAYTYSVVESPDNVHKGVFAGQEEDWSGPGGQTQPFLIAAVKVDTDAAYKTALGKAGDYDKNIPGKTTSLLLEKNKKYPDPAWRVIWGESVGTSGLSVFIDASTGQFLEKVH
jgi:hypothetical protein